MQSLFERMGRLSATRALANEFYNVMENDKSVRRLLALHPKKLIMPRIKLYKFLTQWFGGPALFGEKYVNAEWLELKHRRLNFNEDEKNQWLYCMTIAMNNLKFDPELKDETLTMFKDMIEKMQALQA